MDREANLPVPPDKPPKSLVRPTLNQESSSSSSSPELIRHLQAAFKRHRPLNKMQTTTIGPRRSVAPQRQPSRSSRFETGSTAEGQKPQDVVSLSQSLAANTLTQDTRKLASSVTRESTENASITPPSMSGTIDNMCGENFIPSDRQMDLRKPVVTSLECNLDIGSRNENVNRKVQSLVNSTLTSHDMEWDATNQAEASNVGACTRSKHQNVQTVDSETSLKSDISQNHPVITEKT